MAQRCSTNSRRSAHVSKKQPSSSGAPARRLAIKALERIEEDGAYANLVLPGMLERSSLPERDRGFVTELVYGTTRMKRACDFLVDRFVLNKVEPQVRAALRIGAYQLHFLDTPRHAAVDATVGAVHGRGRGVVNAVLRRVADDHDKRKVTDTPVPWPDLATELSYPSWLVKRFVADIGDEAEPVLRLMNRAAVVHERDDGYVQDPASQAVVAAVGAKAGELVVDVCAAPGGKATGIAATGATVIAADLQPHRVGLITKNIARSAPGTGTVAAVIADAGAPPIRAGSVDRVLVDAPCSGLGSLRRRPDARWRLDHTAPERLRDLQVDLVMASIPLLRAGGVLTYSVCTLTDAEGAQVRDAVAERVGTSATVGELTTILPTESSDGMMLFQLTIT